jgi:hypothetical protein
MKLETKLKHTPAPWQLTTIDGVPRRKHLMVGAGYDGGLAVALMRTDHAGATSETLEANARLIAAAPELLAALRYIVIGDEDHEDLDVSLDVSARRKADAALAKAIGELRYDTLDYDTK